MVPGLTLGRPGRSAVVTQLLVASEFSPYLGGRVYDDGPFSGQEFREKFLRPRLLAAIEAQAPLHVVFDGVAGMPTSFLEEAFGGLLRTTPNLNLEKVRGYLRLEAEDPELWPFLKLAEQYMSQQADRSH
ncbi:MAG: DUF4325 domain-containing protein [Phenylobacterium sp.]|nr:MAG: DUF4325 domain-containing protein [Phenylobacterium sp.]